MNVELAYLGHSAVIDRPGRQTFQLVPNLTRDPVAFDAPLTKPLRFREAMSALHDTVVSDLRFKKRDKAAYHRWKEDEQQRAGSVRREAFRAAVTDILAKQAQPVEPDPVFKPFGVTPGPGQHRC